MRTAVIHHGISAVFEKEPIEQKPISEFNWIKPFKLLYVSTVFQYKHQLNVVESIDRLRKKGFPVVLKLVGGVGQKEMGDSLTVKIRDLNKNGEYIEWLKNVGLSEVVDYYHSSDAFIFASSCENMPNILMEAMASGLPIACSSSKPMPEFMEDAGLYFNPSDIDQLEVAVEKLVSDSLLRKELSNKSFLNSKKYSWLICADKTFNFLFTLSKK
jgi:glycosyltransferase involved in cell wall biosynthesis